jgi:hypothetical protein
MLLASVRRLLTALVVAGAGASLVGSCAGSLRPPTLGPPDLTEPVDRLTRGRLAGLARDDALCRAVLAQAGVAVTLLPPLADGRCGYTNAVRLAPRPAPAVAFRPDSPGMACPLAAATHLWLRDVVAPAAQQHLGSRLVAIDHFGTYACRNLYGRADTDLSEHARANALDVAGFRLADGRRVTLVAGWNGTPAERAFLREVRDGGCRLFATVLSPDYNQAHADHFHLDMAARSWGGVCR